MNVLRGMQALGFTAALMVLVFGLLWVMYVIRHKLSANAAFAFLAVLLSVFVFLMGAYTP